MLVLAVALSLVAAPAFGQAVNTGNVTGTTTDPQGAVVPGVKITLQDVASSTNYTTTTNDQGRFFIPNVAVATYNITATKGGFATAKVSDQAVSIGTTSTFNIQMTVGAVTTTVEVQASNIQLQTMNATIGNTVPAIALTSLPAIGLDVSTFAVLQPGVSPGGQVAGTNVDQSSFQLDGGNNTNDMDGSMTVYTGSFTGDPSGGIIGNGGLPSGVVPTPADSVEEIKTNTTNQTADFNSSSGMQVQVTTKKGTDRWHGTVYEYYLDNNFSANSWDNNCTTDCGKSYTRQPDWHRHWFGVAGGGPIIPKRILGGKTYFFANYQGTRWHNSTTNTKTIPGPGMLQGLLEFSNGGTISVYNLNPTATTYTGPTLTGKCSKCGLVNGVTYPVGISTVGGTSLDGTPLDPRGLGINTAVNPVSQMWNKYVPKLLALPGINYGGGAGDGNTFGFTSTEAIPLSDNFGVARLDHDFGDKWHFFGSYRYYRLTAAASTQTDVGGFLPGCTVGVACSASSVPQVPWIYVLGLTTNLTSTTTNDFHYSFTRNWWAWARAGDPAQLSGLGGALEPGGETSSSLSPYNVNTQSTRTRFWDGLDTMYRDDLTSLKGNHLLQFGGSYQRNHDKHQRTDNGGGINYYPVYQVGSGTSAFNKATATLPSIISSGNVNNYAKEYDEILGIVNISQIAYTRSGANLSLNKPLTPASEDSIIPYYNVYFSDSWHLKPSFTLTYGLGWTLEMPPVDKNGNIIVAVDSSDQQLNVVSYLDARKKAALQGQPYDPTIGFALIGNVGGAPKYPYNPFYGEFSPRVAVAWNPDMGDGFFGKHLFGGKNTVLRAGYSRIYGRLNGVDLVLVPLLGTGLIQPVQCVNPTTAGAATCGQGLANASNAFRIGKDGATAPLAAASPTLAQPDFPGVNICGPAGAVCAAAGAGEGFDPNFRPNVTDGITVTIQRQLGQHNSLEFGYIGRLVRNEYLPLNTNAVPYMFTMGGQQFQQAYAGIEKQMGCATSAAACYNADPTLNVTPQPFFEAALAGTGYCNTFSSCTAAVYAKQFLAFQGQNVWSLWSALDKNYPGCAATYGAANCAPGFNFGPTMQNSPGAGGAPFCQTKGAPPSCTLPGFQLSSGLGLNASVGYGNYHGGFVSWKMSNWHGLTSQSNFTWSKALGTNSQVQASSELTADDPYRIATNYGLQAWDRKFVFNSFLVYEPPFFKGQTGLIGRLLGGWNIAPIFSWATGWDEPCYPTLGGAGSNIYYGAQEFGSADGSNYGDTSQCVPLGKIPSQSLHTGVTGGKDSAGNDVGTPGYPGGANVQLNGYADPLSIWNKVRPAILGIDNIAGDNSGTGLLRGLPFWNVDLSVKKNFKVTERLGFTFQTVFTNVFNHNQFADSTINLADPSSLGVIGGQANSPRHIELGLRINF